MARLKFKSRSHYDVVHQQPLKNVPTKYQLHTPYGFRDMAQTKYHRLRSLRQSQRSNQGHTMTQHTYNPQPMSLSSINFTHLMVSEIEAGQDFIGQGHCSKVKSRSHYDAAHLQPPTNIPTKYQFPSPYGFRDIAQTKFLRSRSL